MLAAHNCTCKRFFATGVKDIQTCYKLLGVSSGASEDQIKKAFYEKSLVYHPDKNPNNKDSVKIFQEITEAHKILIENIRSPNSGGDSQSNYDFTNQWINRSETFRTTYTTATSSSSHYGRANSNNEAATHFNKTSRYKTYSHVNSNSISDVDYRYLIEKDHQRLMEKRRQERDNRNNANTDEKGCAIQ